MPQLNPYWILSQVFWLFLSFAFLYIVMVRAGLPRLADVLQNRRARIAADLELAEAASKQSEVLERENQAQIKTAKGRAAEIISEIQKESDALAAQRHADLDRLLQRKMAEAQTSIDAAEKDALMRVIPISVEITQAVLQHVAGMNVSREAVEKVVAGHQMRSKHV